MFLLTSTLLLISTGVSKSHYQQMLSCPYKSEDTSLTRVWCKRDSQNHECCSGFAFHTRAKALQDGNLRVQDDGKAFVISVIKLTGGDGVYWCGLRNGTNTIIKLAEGHFYSSESAPLDFVWAILRWLIFSVLLSAVVVIKVYSIRKNRQREKMWQLRTGSKTEERLSDTTDK